MSSLKDLASLIMVPSLYKDGELHTVKPLADENIIVHPDATDNNDGVDGTTPSTSSNFTFSRGSNLAATRVDVNGLIEKGRENLALYSNTFTSWNQYAGITLTSGQSGYDGTNDAWELEKDASGPYLAITQSPNASGVVTFSFYAKQGTLRYLNFYEPNSTAQIWFDLQEGTISHKSGTRITTNIEAAANGFYRCSVTWNAGGTTECRLYPTSSSNSYSSNAGNVYIQDAQLEQGLVATDYIETGTSAAQSGILEDMPRLDYSGGASCPSLLLEPQRSNIMTQSEYIVGGISPDGVTLTHNHGTSPEGVQNSVLLTQTGGSSSNSLFNFGLPQVVGDYSYSFFIKAGTSTSCRIYQRSDNTTTLENFNPQTISAGETGGDLNLNFESYENDWWRVSFTKSVTTTNAHWFVFYPDRSNLGRNVEIYGFQWEAGSYPTSYIPTYGTSQTRSNDSCKNTTITDFQSTDATLFFEFNYDSSKTGSFRYVFSTENSTASNFDLIGLQSNSSGNNFFFTITNSGISFPTLSLLSGTNKVLLKFERSTKAVKAFLNGTEVTSATATSIPEIHKIALGGRLNAYSGFATDRELGDIVKQALVFPTALTDSECIALTTL